MLGRITSQKDKITKFMNLFVCSDELALQFNLPFARKPIILADADLAFSKKFVALWASFAETGYSDKRFVQRLRKNYLS